MAKKTEKIEVKGLGNKIATIRIAGDSDLILNKMNDPTARKLTDARKDKAKDNEKPNMWEEIITAMHWRDGKPVDFSEEGLKKALTENAPCITDFGLKKSFMDSVVRNGVDKYSTKFNATVNLTDKGGLVPITFVEHCVDEKLMSPKKGSPVLVHLNRFSGWSAEFTISYMETSYGIEQILQIIQLAGFGIGIGSGRSSGFGRYHIEEVMA